MPSLGQNFRFGFFDVPACDRLSAIKNAGFDDVMLWWGSEFTDTDGTPQQLFDEAQKLGLSVHTAHFPTAQTPELWREGEAGEQYERALIAALRALGERGIRHLVVHTTKKLITPEPNMAGVRHMRNAAAAAEQYGVDIALENTRFLRYNQYLYDHVPSERMRFCFDCGHANCFTPDEDPLARFGDRLVTMHLHDNHGAKVGDEHRLPGEGNVDFARISERLALLNPKSYNLESYLSEQDRAEGMSMDDYLARSYDVLCAIARGAQTKTA